IGGNKTIKPLAWGGVEMSEGSGLNAIFEFNWPEGVNADTVTLVVVHEVVEVGNGPATLSAISWAVEAPSEDVQGSGWVVLLLIGCAFVSLFLRSRSSF
ncbi:MAG TPA: hypothetical protein D7H94_01700, partial [Candidatus Poseidoniales archaeon]